MPGFDISILGQSEAFRAFDALPMKLQALPLRQALRAGAKVFLAAVKAEAPRDSGTMAENFYLHQSSSMKKGVVSVTVQAGKKDDLDIPEFTKAGTPRGYYPVAIEYGWRPSNRPLARGRRRHLQGLDSFGIIRAGVHRAKVEAVEFGTARVPANPFMHRAFESAFAEAQAAVAAELTARVEAMTNLTDASGAPVTESSEFAEAA